MSVLVGEQAELIVVFGGQQLTSPDCICTGCNMSAEYMAMSQRQLNIDLSFVSFGDGWQSGLDGDCKKISKQLVGKCTINELLFAIREKVKRGDK